MSTMDRERYSEWFVSRVRALARSYSSDCSVLLAFAGLSPFQAGLLSQLDCAVSGIASDSKQGICCYDPDSFQNLKKAVFMELFNSSKPVVMLYEQLLDLRGSISELYSGRIIVVRNNLFSDFEGYPSPVSTETLASLAAEEDEVGAHPTLLSNYYARVRMCDGFYLTTPIWQADEEGWDSVDLYERSPVRLKGDSELTEKAIPFDSSSFLKYRFFLSEGVLQSSGIGISCSLAEEERLANGPLGVLSYLMDCLGLPISFFSISDSGDKVVDTDLLLPILKQYWGRDAKFKYLKIYSNPNFSNEMRSISQATIAEYVVHQAEIAHDGALDYKNVFVTAPTGAGKSALFQIPALYLARKYKTVTLVIEPLKALMVDQVDNLRNRGVTEVVAINSDIPYKERTESYRRIERGDASIIYLSPELLLESSLETILNGRDLGLVVIDEVHTVTSWGKDFRPDYWYLGPYLANLKKSGRYNFPVFCLTATAVYGGCDDVVNQTISDLELGDCRLFLGNPRRDDISFDIRKRDKRFFPGPIEEVKTDLAWKWIAGAVAENRHAIVYCPYRSQVETILGKQKSDFSKVLGYHGGCDRDYKKSTELAFKTGSCRVLVSTKAYGMGIDVDDIDAVYHYAPTGNLADYIQEIGRGGRRSDISATAVIDFFRQDTRYAEQLYALSKYYQWQLREMMAKLYEVYSSQPRSNRSQNFLVSPNSFSYLFSNESDEDRKANRVKSGLMMIARDLEDKFNFPVLIVKPKLNYSKQYVCIAADSERGFVAKYGKFLNKISDGNSRTEWRTGQNAVIISDSGPIYELSIGEMWASEFANLTFSDFKRRLFSGEICGGNEGPALSNRMLLEVSFAGPFDEIVESVDTFAEAFKQTIFALRHNGDFTAKDFKQELSCRLRDTRIQIQNYTTLLNAFVRPVDAHKQSISGANFRCIKQINRGQDKHAGWREPKYGVLIGNVQAIANNISQTLAKMRPSEGQTVCRRYLNSQSLGPQYALSEILEVLKLASYTIRGGDNPEIFIRLNDAAKINALSKDEKYSNSVLKELNERHQYSSKVIRGFFEQEMSDEDRWDLVEEYFLGNDDYVAQALGISGEGQAELARPKVTHKSHGHINKSSVAIKNQGSLVDGGRLFRVWNDLLNERFANEEIQDLNALKALTRGSNFEMPYKQSLLMVEDGGFELHPLLVWKEGRVLLFAKDRADEYARAKATNWTCYLLGQGKTIAKLADDIRVEGPGNSNIGQGR